MPRSRSSWLRRGAWLARLDARRRWPSLYMRRGVARRRPRLRRTGARSAGAQSRSSRNPAAGDRLVLDLPGRAGAIVGPALGGYLYAWAPFAPYAVSAVLFLLAFAGFSPSVRSRAIGDESRAQPVGADGRGASICPPQPARARARSASICLPCCSAERPRCCRSSPATCSTPDPRGSAICARRRRWARRWPPDFSRCGL